MNCSKESVIALLFVGLSLGCLRPDFACGQDVNQKLLPLKTRFQSNQRTRVELRPQFHLQSPLHRFAKVARVNAKPTEKQIVYEMRMIQVDTAQAKEIYQFVDSSTIQIGSAELPIQSPRLKAKPSGEGKGKEVVSDSISSSTIETRNQPVAVATIKANQLPKMLAHLKSIKSANIMQAPTITTFDRQLATLNDTVIRPFVVGIKPITDGIKIAQQPIIQTVEEGTVIRVQGEITEKDIQLQMEIVKSEICGVDTYSFSGEKDAVVTIQVPQQKVRQAFVTKKLADGENLFVDLCAQTIERPVQKTGLNKLSLIENLKKNPQKKQVEQRLLLVLTPRIIETQNVNRQSILDD